jgi:hypothetical protein
MAEPLLNTAALGTFLEHAKFAQKELKLGILLGIHIACLGQKLVIVLMKL